MRPKTLLLFVRITVSSRRQAKTGTLTMRSLDLPYQLSLESKTPPIICFHVTLHRCNRIKPLTSKAGYYETTGDAS
ncbi:MAG TPA: hypothetical protein VFW59_01555 [Gallionella sp.]|nr:hypothetical protein [Gallionella sp.]